MKELSKIEKEAYDKLRETLEFSDDVDLCQVLLNANTRINRLQDEKNENEQLKQNRDEGGNQGQSVTIIQGETPVCDHCTYHLQCCGYVSGCKGFALSKQKDDEIFKQKQKLNAIKRLAETLVHNNRTCSLEAQGFSQVECAEIATEDSIAYKLLGIINGVGELKKDITESEDK